MQTAYLSLFPLELAPLPGESVKLHIFEPRYKQLIQECRDTGVRFGIPAFIDGALARHGTEMALEAIHAAYPGGEMDIAVKGQRPFKLERFEREAEGKPYPGGSVVFLPNEPCDPEDLAEALARLYQELRACLGGEEAEHGPGAPGEEGLAFSLAPRLGLSLEQRTELLALQAERDRRQFLVEHLQEFLPILRESSDIRRRVQGNGHFHRFPSIDL